jgi:hypothetical protein
MHVSYQTDDCRLPFVRKGNGNFQMASLWQIFPLGLPETASGRSFPDTLCGMVVREAITQVYCKHSVSYTPFDFVHY